MEEVGDELLPFTASGFIEFFGETAFVFKSISLRLELSVQKGAGHSNQDQSCIGSYGGVGLFLLMYWSQKRTVIS